MTAERDLGVLLRHMKPEECEAGHLRVLHDPGQTSPFQPRKSTPLLTFREQEGTTLVVLREEAEAAGLSYAFASRT